MATVGELIGEKYEILREIGRGGMSYVYLAVDKKIGTYWAVKQLRKDKDDLSNQVAQKALKAEAELMKKLNHPALPRIVDIIDDGENFYVVMDYIAGESLDKILKRSKSLPQNMVVDIAIQLCDVLHYLHTQNPPIIYRDMKPANIIWRPDGTVALVDLGIAREYKYENNEDTQWIGTRGYAAPEQFGGRGQSDARTDIYGLGITLYHLITGSNPTEPPYELYPIRHFDSKFSSDLEKIIIKCTQNNPDNRYDTCAEVKHELLAVGEKKVNKLLIILPIVAAVLLAVIIAVLLYLKAEGDKNNNLESLLTSSQDSITSVESETESVISSPSKTSSTKKPAKNSSTASKKPNTSSSKKTNSTPKKDNTSSKTAYTPPASKPTPSYNTSSFVSTAPNTNNGTSTNTTPGGGYVTNFESDSPTADQW